MSKDSYTRTKVNKDLHSFFHHLWSSSLGAFFLCMILPFVATLASEGPRIPRLYHRDLDDSNLLVHFANSLGLWPLFTVLFAAGFPTVSILWACHRHRPYFTNMASVEYYAGLLVAGSYSIVFWMFWTPWSNPDQLEGMVWSVTLAIVYPGLNILLIGILVIFYHDAEDAEAGKNLIGGATTNRLAVLSRAETQVKSGYVWVFDLDSKLIGIWVPNSLLNSDTRD